MEIFIVYEPQGKQRKKEKKKKKKKIRDKWNVTIAWREYCPTIVPRITALVSQDKMDTTCGRTTSNHKF